MKQLEESGLGKLIINKSKGSVKVCNYIQLANNVLMYHYYTHLITTTLSIYTLDLVFPES